MAATRTRTAITTRTERLRDWWRGKHVPIENDPDSDLFLCGTGDYDRPLIAIMSAAIAGFCTLHWQWLIATAIALVGAIAALAPLLR